MKYSFIAVLMVLSVAAFCLTACAAKFNTTDLAPGMTQQEVIQRLGKPVSATLANGDHRLIFKIHDEAYGRDENFYAIGFKDDHLVSIAPLPEDQQEMGLIDRALRQPRFFINR